jgi:hypothetical protein
MVGTALAPMIGRIICNFIELQICYEYQLSKGLSKFEYVGGITTFIKENFNFIEVVQDDSK